MQEKPERCKSGEGGGFVCLHPLGSARLAICFVLFTFVFVLSSLSYVCMYVCM